MQQADAPASSVLVRARSSKCSMVVGWQAALLWAVLCSVALRDSRDRLVAEAERLLDGTRSLFRVAATLTLMPLSALSANLEVRGCHLRGLALCYGAGVARGWLSRASPAARRPDVVTTAVLLSAAAVVGTAGPLEKTDVKPVHLVT